jgi:capsular polysaccharide biosynthesis protein
VLNEEKVISVLEEQGFETILSSKLSFREKINLFYKAKIVVSASSAGLGSLFYGNAEGRVLEIFSQGFVHTHYYNMAKAIGMDYEYIICQHPSPATNGKQGERENITVEIDKLEEAVTRMLASSTKVSQLI